MIELETLVAAPNVAPHRFQAVRPDSIWTRKPPVDMSPDLTRVLEIEHRPSLEPGSLRARALVALMNERLQRPQTLAPCRCAEFKRKCITSLREVQAWALFELGVSGGLLGAIAVGAGKTMLDLLAPLVTRNCRIALLLVPPNLVDQLIRDYQLVSQHFRVPSIVVHGKNWSTMVSGAPVLHVLPYSILSRPTSTALLEEIRPDLIIADEVDRLRNVAGAGASRVARFMAAHPECRFCGWTGSLTDASIGDYWHIAAWALREGSPLPLDQKIVEDWARAIDPGDVPAPAGALLKLCEPGEHVQDGYHRRFVETRGVVHTTDAPLDAELHLVERDAPELPEALRTMIRELRDTWKRPDGMEQFVDSLQVAKCACELAAGFFYRWRYPHGEPDDLIQEWLDARKDWHWELRQKLKHREEHMDSEQLCTHAAERAWGIRPVFATGPGSDLPVWRAATFMRWYRVRDLVHPETEAVRVDDFLARDAAAWALENRGIVWYDKVAFGAWVAELSGLPLHGGGPKAGAEIEKIVKNGCDTSIIASINSHGRGRDGLQFLYDDQLVANPPSSSTRWEQVLGRLHRPGQESNRVWGRFYRHTEEMCRRVDTAVSRAAYVQRTLGSAQKLIVGFAIGGAGWETE